MNLIIHLYWHKPIDHGSNTEFVDCRENNMV